MPVSPDKIFLCCLHSLIGPLSSVAAHISPSSVLGSFATRMVFKLQQLLSRISLWTKLKAIGNRPLSRLVILIPLIGYWIIFNKNIQSFIALKWDHVPQPGDESVPWKLLSTYFGLCFVAVATFLYEVFCPEETKRYSSPAEHASARFQFTSDIEFNSIEKLIEGKYGRICKPVRERLFVYKDKPLEMLEAEELERRGSQLRILNIYFDILDQSNSTLRIIIQSLYAVGFLALTIPAFVIFLRVSKELLKEIVG